MRITESHLRQIIREEMRVLLEYEQYLVRRGDETFLGNDEGDEKHFDSDPESHGLYKDGDTAPYNGPRGGGGYSGYGGYGGYSGYGRGSRRRRY